MTWWRGQHLDEVREDRDGIAWHFRVWHNHVDGVYIQRLFFWDAAKTQTGVIEFEDDTSLHVSRLRQCIGKIVQQPQFRARYLRPLRFPIEGEYREYAQFEKP